MRGAIAGFGAQGKVHFEAMRSLGIEVVAICDSNPKVFGSEQLPKLYEDWESMLREQEVGVLSVATWTADHAPITIGASNRGVKAILCEKPMSNSLDSARRMIEACNQNGTILTINHSRRWHPEYQRIQEIITQGTIGDLRNLWVSCGGARIGDLAPHFIDWMMWMTGSDVDHVIGYLDPITEPNPRGTQFEDPPGSLLLAFKNGVRGWIDISQNVALPVRCEIVGTKGRIYVEEFDGEFHLDVRAGQGPFVSTLDYHEGLDRIEAPKVGRFDEVGMVASAILELTNRNTTSSGENGYKVIECLVAAHLSHERGHTPLKLPLKDRRELARTLLGA